MSTWMPRQYVELAWLVGIATFLLFRLDNIFGGVFSIRFVLLDKPVTLLVFRRLRACVQAVGHLALILFARLTLGEAVSTSSVRLIT